jgi:hypothetical protein
LSDFVDQILARSPHFAQLRNRAFHPEWTEGGRVRKEKHGAYSQEPYGINGENIQEYTDWLRKVRLDMAMTLYLRGLNQIG